MPVVVLLSRADNYFAEPAWPGYFRVVTLACFSVMLNIVFKIIFKRYYTA
ncbi:hypothetical protein MKQ70_09570 [Chitinophaga sedimenti]|nr:hypothetical protein [Chitinophaga sedimenti]MCK7555239.1 hypothetical protein [Chitinophaga sedimenti]